MVRVKGHTRRVGGKMVRVKAHTRKKPYRLRERVSKKHTPYFDNPNVVEDAIYLIEWYYEDGQTDATQEVAQAIADQYSASISFSQAVSLVESLYDLRSREFKPYETWCPCCGSEKVGYSPFSLHAWCNECDCSWKMGVPKW